MECIGEQVNRQRAHGRRGVLCMDPRVSPGEHDRWRLALVKNRNAAVIRMTCSIYFTGRRAAERISNRLVFGLRLQPAESWHVTTTAMTPCTTFASQPPLDDVTMNMYESQLR
eukprot:gnl/TRDRNA2_/TRDRNA2_65551_c0_seq1.p2 gnl/TRDRNA2_/TRDRNA2_65551_c0~~gnl/TRDRNA2_/TRDRNA2_65551_c0_seq1.p2  ORF type:complete len:113 (-),score=5.28 gnl/TRDRNA2_/TRDRNA2_65551_c0_seq1:63-401(-)